MKSPWLWILVIAVSLLFLPLAVLLPTLSEARNTRSPRERAFLRKLAGIVFTLSILFGVLSYFAPELSNASAALFSGAMFWLVFWWLPRKRKQIREAESKRAP